MSEKEELPGALGLAIGVSEQRWPHTVDARQWVEVWIAYLPKDDTEALAFVRNRGCMHGWFANAIMAGYDTATMRNKQKPSPV